LEFEAVCQRLDEAATALYAAGAYSQAAARRYYLVYHIACFVAHQTGLQVTHRYDRRAVPSMDYRHEELPDIVLSLYTMTRTSWSAVTVVGGTAGIGGGLVTDRDIWTKVEKLKARRIAADYLGGGKEPLTKDAADALIADANAIVQDLRGLLP
jgi:hypothetical protein